MGRPREFDSEVALDCALRTFWTSGYDGTSLDQLLADTKLSRQSLYNAFGDKEALFLTCLGRYQAQSLERLREALSGPVRRGFERVFRSILDESDEAKRRGCFMVNSAMELAPRHVQVADVVATNLRLLEDLFASTLARGVASKELTLSPGKTRSTARFLVGALQGLRVVAKSDPHSEALRDMVSLTLRALEPT
jgi:TetR/AcrR family transcriptional repressor of nem operon